MTKYFIINLQIKIIINLYIIKFTLNAYIIKYTIAFPNDENTRVSAKVFNEYEIKALSSPLWNCKL